MFVGSINKGKDLSGYAKNNLFEPLSIQKRHEALATEMVKLGYNHNSPLPFYVHQWSNYLMDKVNVNKSFVELMSRCANCRDRNLW